MPLKIEGPKTVTKLGNSRLTVKKLKNVKYTGLLMNRLAVRYCDDVAMYGHLSLIQFYDLVKNIPYKEDPKAMEFLQRPYYTLTRRGKGGDCDDKSICMGAYLYIAEIPFRFVAVGKYKEKRLHHVITEAKIDDEIIHLDPTYSFNVIGYPLGPYEKKLIISEWEK